MCGVEHGVELSKTPSTWCGLPRDGSATQSKNDRIKWESGSVNVDVRRGNRAMAVPGVPTKPFWLRDN